MPRFRVTYDVTKTISIVIITEDKSEDAAIELANQMLEATPNLFKISETKPELGDVFLMIDGNQDI